MLSSFSSLSISSPSEQPENSVFNSENLFGQLNLSTCYDSLFDISSFENDETQKILISDDARLRLFRLDSNGISEIFEQNQTTKKQILDDQVLEIVWSSFINKFIVLTTSSLKTFDQNFNILPLEIQIEQDAPSFWRMTCFSMNLFLNLGLGASIRLFNLKEKPLVSVKSWSRPSLNYKPNDLISALILNSDSVLAMNVELENHRHTIDLFVLTESNELKNVRRIDTKNICALDVVCSLPNSAWLCKSHWPSDDSLCLVESNGQVKKISLGETTGYIINVRLTSDQSKIVLVRTAKKLPKEIEQTDSNVVGDEKNEVQTKKRDFSGKLPSNLVLEIYRLSSFID